MSTFHNFTDEVLADEIGTATSDIKAREERLDLLKEEFKRRDLSSARGLNWVVTTSTAETKRLDTKALQKDLGDALDGYYKSSVSTRVLVKPRPQEAE